MNNIIVSQAKISFLLCAALGLFLLPSFAQAFFSDTETSSQQQFQASELQLETSLTQPAIMIGTNQAAATTSLLVNTTAQSVSAVFDIAVTWVTGDVAFCDNINLQAQNGAVTAQAVLPAFTTLEQTTFGAYELAVSFIDDGLVTAGQECVVTLAVTAWQQNMSKGSGYQDTHVYKLTITATELAVLRQAAPLVSGDTEEDSADALPSKDAKPPATDAAQSAGGGGSDAPVGPPATPVVAGESDTPADPAIDEGEESTNQPPKEPADETNKQPEAPSEPAATPEHEADTPTDPSAPDTGVEIDVPADDVAPTQTDESTSPEEWTEPESAEDTDEGTSQPPEPAPAQPEVKPDPEPVTPPKAASDDAATDPVTKPEPAVMQDEVANE